MDFLLLGAKYSSILLTLTSILSTRTPSTIETEQARLPIHSALNYNTLSFMCLNNKDTIMTVGTIATWVARFATYHVTHWAEPECMLLVV